MIVEASPEIVIIPEGFFLMGSENGPENEMPRHRVWVDSFGLGKFPVTNREYRIFVEAEQVPAPSFWSETMFAEPEQPVVGVNWESDRIAVVQLTSKIPPPSEAEWEQAARGAWGALSVRDEPRRTLPVTTENGWATGVGANA
jgi:formylglycine-generating enzyme required for sulfatase activity